MIVVLSDLHLGDNTCAKTLSADAFRIFRDLLEQMVFTASVRDDGRYRPIEEVDLLLLGDIFELIHSTKWLDQKPGDPGFARPWSDPNQPELPAKLFQITRSIMATNAQSFAILRQLASGEAIVLPPADMSGKPALDVGGRIPVKVNIHYMVGNHDWMFHLPGEPYNQLRQEVIDTLGLQNDPTPFPFDPHESNKLMALFDQYRIFARHGDYFDKFNFNREQGRDVSTLGDALAIDLLNRFPLEVERAIRSALPDEFYRDLHEITNIRPSVAAPLWISSQVRQYGGAPNVQAKVKAIWDQLAEEFLALKFVRAHDNRWNPFDSVDGLEMVLKFTKLASFESINDLITWIQKKVWSDELSFARHAISEAAFTSRRADFIVYGHTHHHEIVPLDTYSVGNRLAYQIMVNTGTWRTYYDLTRYRPEEQKFIPYQLMTYLAFYKEDERRGHRYEAWSGRLV